MHEAAACNGDLVDSGGDDPRYTAADDCVEGVDMMGGQGLGIAFPVWLLVTVVLWSVLWKGLALWHAARRGEAWWFIALLVINTAGILEIVYLFFFAKRTWRDLFA